MRIAFFDWECTLVLPKFETQTGVFVSALLQDDYEYFVKNHKDPYRDFIVPKVAYDFVEHLRELHIPCYILTCDTDSEVRKKKLDFIQETYGKLFDKDHVIFVDEEIDKITVIRKYQRRSQYIGRDCYFLDDDPYVLREACAAKIDAHPAMELLLKSGYLT